MPPIHVSGSQGIALLTAILMIGSSVVIGFSGGVAPAAADEHWAENCDDAPLVDATGTYSGVLEHPQDRDYFRIDLEEGDYVTVAVRAPAEARERAQLWWDAESAITVRNEAEERGVSISSRRIHIKEPGTGEESSVEIWADEDQFICFYVRELDEEEADIPYEWQVSLDENTPEVTWLDAPTYDPGEETSDDEETTDEDSLIGEEADKVEDLEQEIDDLEQELAEKEEEIEKLEAQIEETNGEQDIVIDVTVEPGEGQQSFVAGGTALITAQSDHDDVSNLEIEYEGETYAVSDTGEAELPLVGTGDQELAFVYGDTTEVVSVAVAAADADDDEPHAADDDTGGIEEMPGFGLIIAVMAVLLSMLLYSRNLNRES